MPEARLEDTGDGAWKLTGDMDFTTVSRLLRSTPRDFVSSGDIRLDLSGVTRADSAGLALLVEWLRESGRNGNRIAFLNMPEQMQMIACVCGLADILSGTAVDCSGQG